MKEKIPRRCRLTDVTRCCTLDPLIGLNYPVWKLPMRSCAPRISVKSSISLLVLFLLRTKAPIHLCALDGFFSKVTPQLRGPAAPFGINQADIADSFGPLRRIFARFPF